MQEAPWVWLYALVLERFWHPETCQVLQRSTHPIIPHHSCVQVGQCRLTISIPNANPLVPFAISLISKPFTVYPFPALCPTRLFYGLCIFAANLFPSLHTSRARCSYPKPRTCFKKKPKKKLRHLCNLAASGKAAMPSALAIFSGHHHRLSRAAAASLLGAMAPKVDAIESWHGESPADEMCCKGAEVLEVLEATRKK